MKARVQRWGNSLALRIPKAFADNLGLVENGAVDLTVSAGKLVAVPAKPSRLSELLAGITETNVHSAEDWGPPLGNEVW